MGKTNILMCSSPGGNRGPANAYGNHLRALSMSESYNVFDISGFSRIDELSNIDIFWFSVRFHPDLYYAIKNRYPDRVYVMGPNVLFEKAEVGPSDPWEEWFVDNVSADFYFNKADFYLDRAKEFYTKSKTYAVLRNCIDLSSYDSRPVTKDLDVLLYYKNRRIDNQLDHMFPEFMRKLDKMDLSYQTISYGSYDREDYFRQLRRSKLCVWFSIEDFCANAQLEAQYFNVPVLGTKHNCTENFDSSLIVPASKMTNGSWVKWVDEMPQIFVDRISDFFNEDVDSVNDRPSKFIEENYSYAAYEKQINRIFK